VDPRVVSGFLAWSSPAGVLGSEGTRGPSWGVPGSPTLGAKSVPWPHQGGPCDAGLGVPGSVVRLGVRSHVLGPGGSSGSEVRGWLGGPEVSVGVPRSHGTVSRPRFGFRRSGVPKSQVWSWISWPAFGVRGFGSVRVQAASAGVLDPFEGRSLVRPGAGPWSVRGRVLPWETQRRLDGGP